MSWLKYFILVLFIAFFVSLLFHHAGLAARLVSFLYFFLVFSSLLYVSK